MLVKFKKDYLVENIGLDDKYVDNSFVFKKDNCYYGYFKDNIGFSNLVIESKDGTVQVELDNNQINEYIDW